MKAEECSCRLLRFNPIKVKAFLSFVLFLIFIPIGLSQTLITADSVSGTWEAGGSPYIIIHDVIIPHDTVLIVEPGTEIKFAGNYAIKIDGKLIAAGTKNDKIIFSYADSSELAEYEAQGDTIAADIAGWKGIRFSRDRSENDTSLIAYCTISGAKALTGVAGDCSGGAISILGSGMVIIKNCSISGNQAHIGAAIFSDGCNAIINRNIIENNQSLSNGGAICLFNCRPEFKNNLIRSNTSPEFGGGLYCYKAGGTFVNNIIVDNQARFGGALSLNKSNVRLLNNTIADNHATVNGGGLHCQQSSPFIKNSIIWGNDARSRGQQMFLYTLGYPDIVYSNIQGGLTAIECFSDSMNRVNNYDFNLEDDPVLSKEDTAFYNLTISSPCIDAGFNNDKLVSEGFDMSGNPRIVNNIIDIGAQEFGNLEKIDITKMNNDEKTDENQEMIVNIYSNPNKGKFTVEISGSYDNIAFLGIFNANGQELYNQSIGLNNNNIRQLVEVDFNRGLYFVALKNNKGQVLKKEKIIIE